MGRFLMTSDDEASSASCWQKVVCVVETIADEVMKCQFRLRKPLFYPLNYGDGAISGFRSRIADFK